MKGGGREAKGHGGTGARGGGGGGNGARGKRRKGPPPPPPTHTHETESKRGTNCQRSGRLTAICLISVCCFRLAFLYRRGQEQNLVRHNEPSVALATAQDLGWRLKKLKQTHMSWCSDFSSYFLFIKHFFFSF